MLTCHRIFERFFAILFMVLSIITATLAMDVVHLMPNVREVADGLYEAKIMRGNTPIYLYHQKLKVPEETNFWLSYSKTEDIGINTRGLHLIYRNILEQESETCEYKYSESTYTFMKKLGVSEPEKKLSEIKEACKSRGMNTQALRKLLSGHAAGVTGFNPTDYVVFACKEPITKPYTLKKETNALYRNTNEEDLALFKNILLCYGSFPTSNGGVEHRGIFRPIDDLLFPNPTYKNLAILAHAFGAEVEQKIYHFKFFSVKPLPHMLLLLAQEFPGKIIHDDARAYFYQNIATRPYEEVLAASLAQVTPLNLDELRESTVEQGAIVIDLKTVADRFNALVNSSKERSVP